MLQDVVELHEVAKELGLIRAVISHPERMRGTVLKT
jgi:hypothetical protein